MVSLSGCLKKQKGSHWAPTENWKPTRKPDKSPSFLASSKADFSIPFINSSAKSIYDENGQYHQKEVVNTIASGHLQFWKGSSEICFSPILSRAPDMVEIEFSCSGLIDGLRKSMSLYFFPRQMKVFIGVSIEEIISFDV